MQCDTEAAGKFKHAITIGTYVLKPRIGFEGALSDEQKTKPS